MLLRTLLLAALLVSPALGPATAYADEIRVVSSGGFATAFKELAPAFEKSTGHTVSAAWGPSMGATVNAVPQRLARNEPIDVVIMVGYALGQLADQGRIDARADLARSAIAAAVRQGAPVPDIGTVDALRATMLAARSIVYSDSASGVYIQNEMLQKLGIADQVRGRARMVPADPVGEVVARGEAELGFQQNSELKPIHGITIVGPLPEAVQVYTVFSAGVLKTAPHPEAARALLRFLSAPEAHDAIRRSGMDPVAAP